MDKLGGDQDTPFQNQRCTSHHPVHAEFFGDFGKSKNSCAIYRRKSSEEGLEQSLNSLDAQHEACIAYIQSQKHEGWTVVRERYDDGGFSGGTMDRPGLTKLLGDVQAGKVTTVVVYKVDRLTRSLSDFAKIIEVFDKHKVSFVSVTQQFNTTTSMGRLTLNVLLSFAQFERQLTGERIRDKVAASKKKGMWMGGVVPLGYECVDHRLAINQAEADTVRKIFRSYLKPGCVSKLKNYLDTEQIRSKIRTSSSGRKSGGVGYSHGALYHLLNNRIYIGRIVHRGEVYPGQHEPIISPGMWNEVSALLRANNQAHRKPQSGSTPGLLTGILRDARGVRFTPTHTLKGGKRYRYYTSQAVIQGKANVSANARIPAPELESLVIGQIGLMLESLEKYLTGDTGLEREEILDRAKEMASRWSGDKSSVDNEFLRNVLKSVVVGRDAVSIRVDETKLVDSLRGRAQQEAPIEGTDSGERTIALTTRFGAPRRGTAVFPPDGAHPASSRVAGPKLTVTRPGEKMLPAVGSTNPEIPIFVQMGAWSMILLKMVYRELAANLLRKSPTGEHRSKSSG